VKIAVVVELDEDVANVKALAVGYSPTDPPKKNDSPMKILVDCKPEILPKAPFPNVIAASAVPLLTVKIVPEAVQLKPN